jgi:hypothetical protein
VGFLLIVGALLLVAAVRGWVSDHDLSARGAEGDAEVVQVQHGRDYSLRFTLPGGEVVTEHTAYVDKGTSVGETIRVEYDPKDPSNVAQVGARSGAGIAYVLLGVMGLGLMGAASWNAWGRRNDAGPTPGR